MANIANFKTIVKFKKPINFNPKKTPNSQNLPDIIKLNFAINILLTEQMYKTKSLIGNKPYFFKLSSGHKISKNNWTPFLHNFYNFNIKSQ